MSREIATGESISVVYIEDDRRTARLMARYLESHGVRVTLAYDGPSGIAAAKAAHPSVVLLDVMLPGMNGLDVCHQIRTHSGVPIIMVTARGEEADRVVGLEGGADDYVVKPFSSRELLARIRSMHRRALGKVGPGPLRISVRGLDLDTRTMSATLDGKVLSLTTYEFKLLHALAEHLGRVLSRERLVEIVRGKADESFERSVDVHISHLRQKLNDDPRRPRRLKTVRGEGYVLVGEGG